MSVLDNNLNSKYEMMGYQIALEHDFFIGKADFLNLFSSAYITSNRDLTDYFTGYKMI